MQLTPRRHEMLSCWLLGIGTLFLYLGYFNQCFVTEAIIRSIHTKDPQRISAFAGYYGQAVHYTAFAISTFFSSSLLHYLSSKWMLVLSTAVFSLYHLSFFHLTNLTFYGTQVIMGIAYSLYNSAEGAYLAEHSSRRTVESNTAVETAVGHMRFPKSITKHHSFSMLFGGICLIFIFYFLPSEAHTTPFRFFSDVQIRAIFGTFFAINVVAVITFALMPNKQQPDSIANTSPRVMPGFKQQMQNIMKTIIHPNMLLLAVTVFQMGLTASYMLGVFPTALSFTTALKDDTYVVALYGVSVGLAEFSGGFFLRPMIKKLKQQYKLLVVMGVHVVAVILMVALSLLFVPDRATIEPSENGHLLVAPSRLMACVTGYLIGVADFTITMVRVVICQYAIPTARGEVFSLTRFFQCISSCIVLFLSPYLTVRYWGILLIVGMISGTATFVVLVRRCLSGEEVPTNKDEAVLEDNQEVPEGSESKV